MGYTSKHAQDSLKEHGDFPKDLKKQKKSNFRLGERHEKKEAKKKKERQKGNVKGALLIAGATALSAMDKVKTIRNQK
jgi:reverse gyrase